LYYAFEHHIAYPFTPIKRACPITSRNKTLVWELVSGPSVKSEHPPLRNLKIQHKDQTIEVAPYKIPSEDIITNTKHIIQQNNFTNTKLNTLNKQLTKIEKQIQKIVANPSETTKPIDLKLKKLSFQTLPSQVTKTSQTELQNNKNDFFRAIKDHFHKIEASALIVLDTPQVSNNPSTFTSHINTSQNNQTDHT